MRLRFTTRRLLVFVTCWCIALGVWRTYIYEPPTHKIPLYEKASGTRSLSTRIGPNTIRIAQLARNRRDGTLVVEDGHGTSLPTVKVTNPKHLADSAPWLDVVQIELEPGPGLLDIVEVRIFDHEAQTILGEVSPNFGWQVLKPNLLQIYGIGKELPVKVDVWLRVQSYDAKDQVTRLEPTKGASCDLPGGTLTLKDISGEYSSVDMIKGRFFGQRMESLDLVTSIFSWQGKQFNSAYQIEAVLKSGERHRPDSIPHLLHFDSGKFNAATFRGGIILEEIDHFELRPFRGRHKFFFEAVQLPPSTGKAFAKPPVATLKIKGQEVSVDIPNFAPLAARLTTHRGDWAFGTDGRGRYVLQNPAGVTALEEDFSLVYQMRGIGRVPWQFRFQDAATGKLLTEFETSPHISSQSSGLSSLVGHTNFRKPLKEIDAVEITLQPAP